MSTPCITARPRSSTLDSTSSPPPCHRLLSTARGPSRMVYKFSSPAAEGPSVPGGGGESKLRVRLEELSAISSALRTGRGRLSKRPSRAGYAQLVSDEGPGMARAIGDGEMEQGQNDAVIESTGSDFDQEMGRQSGEQAEEGQDSGRGASRGWGASGFISHLYRRISCRIKRLKRVLARVSWSTQQ